MADVSGGGEAVIGQTATIKGIPRGCTIEVKWSTALDAGSDYDSDATDPPSVDDLQRSLRQALADSFNMSNVAGSEVHNLSASALELSATVDSIPSDLGSPPRQEISMVDAVGSVEALYDFEVPDDPVGKKALGATSPKTTLLAVHAGDIIEVSAMCEHGEWLAGTNRRTGNKGWVPQQYLVSPRLQAETEPTMSPAQRRLSELGRTPSNQNHIRPGADEQEPEPIASAVQLWPGDQESANCPAPVAQDKALGVCCGSKPRSQVSIDISESTDARMAFQTIKKRIADENRILLSPTRL